jgi:hypothetical protein
MVTGRSIGEVSDGWTRRLAPSGEARGECQQTAAQRYPRSQRVPRGARHGWQGNRQIGRGEQMAARHGMDNGAAGTAAIAGGDAHCGGIVLDAAAIRAITSAAIAVNRHPATITRR